jgi:hypothetical protein
MPSFRPSVQRDCVQAPLAGHALELVFASIPNTKPEPATRSLTVEETSTSEGPAIAPTRAPIITAIPPTFSSIASTSPVCSPARTGSPIACSASTVASAQRTARLGPSKVAKNPSPAVSISRPRYLPIIARTVR